MKTLGIFIAGAIALAPLPLWAATPAPAPAGALAPPVAYEVKAGDNLYVLAQRYFTKLADYRTVQKLNRVKNPRRLTVGSKLMIPDAVLRSEPVTAQLVAFRGQVSVSGPSGALTVQKDMPIREGYLLSTAGGAFLTFELPDESRVTLPSQSRLKVQRLRRILMTGAVDRTFAMEDGRSAAVVTPMTNPRDRFQITTPVAVSAVRGTEFRTNYDAKTGRATLEVIEGTVANEAGAQVVLTPAGSGVETTADGVGAPRALLPAPNLVRRSLLQDDETLRFEVNPSAGAGGYRVQLAMDAGFIDIVAEAEAAEPAVPFASLGNGTYFVRATAIDTGGLEGLPATYAFERRLNSLSLGAPAAMEGGRRYLFKWRTDGGGNANYRFVLSRNADGGDAIIDQPALERPQFVVTALPAGVYYWRVLVSRFEDGKAMLKWSKPQRFEVGP